jgi:hypothetical protein
MLKKYLKAARHYENEVDLFEKYPSGGYLPPQVARWRAWTCWSAAIDSGIVVA